MGIKQINEEDQTKRIESLHQKFTQVKVLSQKLDVELHWKNGISDSEASFISDCLKEFLHVKSVEFESELSNTFKHFVVKYIKVYEVIYGSFSKEDVSKISPTTTLSWMKFSLSIIVQNVHKIIIDCSQMLESDDWA